MNGKALQAETQATATLTRIRPNPPTYREFHSDRATFIAANRLLRKKAKFVNSVVIGKIFFFGHLEGRTCGIKCSAGMGAPSLKVSTSSTDIRGHNGPKCVFFAESLLGRHREKFFLWTLRG